MTRNILRGTREPRCSFSCSPKGESRPAKSWQGTEPRTCKVHGETKGLSDCLVRSISDVLVVATSRFKMKGNFAWSLMFKKEETRAPPQVWGGNKLMPRGWHVSSEGCSSPGSSSWAPPQWNPLMAVARETHSNPIILGSPV